MEHEDHAGSGERGGVIPVSTLILSLVRDSSVQAQFITDQLIEAIHPLQSFLFLFLLNSQFVSLAPFSRATLARLLVTGFKVTLFAIAC